MNTRMATLSLLAAGTVALGASAAPRSAPIEHFTAKAVEMTSPARITFRTVDIVVNRWSTDVEHQMLEAALLEKGWVEFVDQLCNFAPAGSIGTVDGPEVTVRYAWQVVDRNGGRRIFLGTDTPISLAGVPLRRQPLPEPLMFLELRVGPNGDGEGKLSEAARLSVDESRNVIELRDYAGRPLHLVMVRSLLSIDE